MKPATRSIVRFVNPGAAIGTLAVIGVGFWFVLGHRNTVAVSPQLAEMEFSQLRARFSNQQPLLDVSRREASEVPVVSQGVARLRSFRTFLGRDRLLRPTPDRAALCPNLGFSFAFDPR